jgi:hypothetical protein
MRVSIKTTANAAAELLGEKPKSAPIRRLETTVKGAGATLEPMHPDVPDDDLRTYFSAEVEDDRVEELLDELRGSEGIEGAYVKPPDALP